MGEAKLNCFAPNLGIRHAVRSPEQEPLHISRHKVGRIRLEMSRLATPNDLRGRHANRCRPTGHSLGLLGKGESQARVINHLFAVWSGYSFRYQPVEDLFTSLQGGLFSITLKSVMMRFGSAAGRGNRSLLQLRRGDHA